MKLGKMFLIFFVCALTFLSECPAGCVAARLCPVRAVPVYPPQMNGNVRCVCMRQFLGKNCRFKVQNGTVVLNATRLSNELVRIEWEEEGEQIERQRYLIYVRKVEYKSSGMIFNKWRKVSMQSWNTNMTGGETEYLQGTKSSDDGIQKQLTYALAATPTANFAIIRLPATSSYEVKVTTTTTAGDHVGSTSVFLDVSTVSVSGQLLGISDALDNFKNDLMETFKDDCVLKGIVAGSAVGFVGTLMVRAFVYVLVRNCSKCRKHRRAGPDEKSVPKEETLETSSAAKSSESSTHVVIEINDMDTVAIESSQTDLTERRESNKSIVLEVNNAGFNPEEPSVSKEDTFEAGTTENVKYVILDIPETVIGSESSRRDANSKEVNPRTIWDTHDHL